MREFLCNVFMPPDLQVSMELITEFDRPTSNYFSSADIDDHTVRIYGV